MARHAGKPLAAIGDGETPLPVPSIIDLRGKIPLSELPWVMSLSSGIISSDSGPMHLARAVDIPVAGIFLQTDPCLGFSPIPGPRVKVISRPLGCKPCSLHGRRSVCPEKTWACRDLSWDEIAADIAAFFAPRESSFFATS